MLLTIPPPTPEAGRFIFGELTLVDLLIVMVRSSALPLRLFRAIPSSSARFLSSSTSYGQLNRDKKLMKRLQRHVAGGKGLSVFLSNACFDSCWSHLGFDLHSPACRHWSYLIALHQHFILPAESLDLLVQLQVSPMIPLGHHVAGALLDRHSRSSTKLLKDQKISGTLFFVQCKFLYCNKQRSCFSGFDFLQIGCDPFCSVFFKSQNLPVSSPLCVLTHSHLTASIDGAFIVELGYTAQNVYAEYLKPLQAASKACLLT